MTTRSETTKRVFVVSTIVFTFCIQTGGSEPDGKREIIDLGVKEYAALGSDVPHLVQHDGILHVFWRGHTQREPKTLAEIPRFPADALRGPWKAGWNSTTYVNRLVDGKWTAASVLTTADVQSAPKFAWSDRRGLNLIIDLGDQTCSHLLLERTGKEWKQIRHFPELKEGCFVELGIRQQGDTLHATTFSRSQINYWRYDGDRWHGPLLIEDTVKFDGMWGYFSPRLALADSGDVHVIWNTQGDPSHVIIRADGVTSKKGIVLNPRVKKGNDIDVEALTDGRLILAYQADENATARQDSIYISEFASGKWGEGTAVAGGTGRTLGSPQLVSRGGDALLVWQHRGDSQKGLIVASGPTASFAIREPSGKWTSPRLVKEIPTEPFAGTGGFPAFYSLYCDPSGKVHMTWGGDSVYYQQLHSFSAGVSHGGGN